MSDSPAPDRPLLKNNDLYEVGKIAAKGLAKLAVKGEKALPDVLSGAITEYLGPRFEALFAGLLGGSGAVDSDASLSEQLVSTYLQDALKSAPELVKKIGLIVDESGVPVLRGRPAGDPDVLVDEPALALGRAGATVDTVLKYATPTVQTVLVDGVPMAYEQTTVLDTSSQTPVPNAPLCSPTVFYIPPLPPDEREPRPGEVRKDPANDDLLAEAAANLDALDAQAAGLAEARMREVFAAIGLDPARLAPFDLSTSTGRLAALTEHGTLRIWGDGSLIGEGWLGEFMDLRRLGWSASPLEMLASGNRALGTTWTALLNNPIIRLGTPAWPNAGTGAGLAWIAPDEILGMSLRPGYIWHDLGFGQGTNSWLAVEGRFLKDNLVRNPSPAGAVYSLAAVFATTTAGVGAGYYDWDTLNPFTPPVPLKGKQ